MTSQTRPGIRAAAWLFALLALAAMGALGCRERTAQDADSLAHAAVGEVVRREGVLSMRGSQPFPMLVLEFEDKSFVRVESKTIQDELERLASMRVAIEGDAMPPIEGVPVLNAIRYEMLRLPSGELPVVGVVSVSGDNCILTERDGTSHWVRGDLVPIILEYDGARIWVVGSAGDETAPGGPRSAKAYWVTGYGVLSESR